MLSADNTRVLCWDRSFLGWMNRVLVLLQMLEKNIFFLSNSPSCLALCWEWGQCIT